MDDSLRLVSIDTGGTFTDVIAIPANGNPIILKIPSTPSNPDEAIVNALKKLNNKSKEIIHGTTVAINAVIQRNGANTALITTKGFRDVIEIGRQNRSDIYELVASRSEPLVERSLRFEVEERISSIGEILIPLNEINIKNMIIELEKNIDQIESIAISLLFSFIYPEHEIMLQNAINSHFNYTIPISISSNVYPEYREFERTSTTVMDAYVKPLVSDYINKLDDVIIQSGYSDTLSIMKSSKGLGVPSGLIRKPVEILVSGLAGGVQAGELTARITGIENIITLDIGGTSTDVAQITDFRVSERFSLDIDGLPVSTPQVDVKTIGAGGGSIAQIKGSLLQVGPESAGAVPGPAAYDTGGDKVTVTDADLLFGVLPNTLGGGILDLKKDRSEAVIEKLSLDLGSDMERTISGVRQIFHENIASALRNVSTERGVDPRRYTLLAFGGAGPVHAIELAKIMGIPNVLIPPFPGIWSAFGLLGADYRYDGSRGMITPLDKIELELIERVIFELIDSIRDQIEEDGIGEVSAPVFIKFLAMRYIGQSYELSIPWTKDHAILRRRFLKEHISEYGFASEEEAIEIVAIRVSATIAHEDPKLNNLSVKDIPQSSTYRDVMNIGSVPVYHRDNLGVGFESTGPLLIDQNDSTTWIPVGWKIKIDNFGFIHAKEVKS